MEEQLRAILLASSGVTALATARRINWNRHPQSAGLPGVVLNVISDAQGLHLKGRDGLFQGRVQADCYASTPEGAKALSRAVRGALHAYRGNGFRLIEEDGAADHGQEGGTNEAERPFRIRVDFTFAWRET